MDLYEEITSLVEHVIDSGKRASQVTQGLERIREKVLVGMDRHLPAYERIGESNVVPILFMDIVGYSKLETDEAQKYAIELLNELVKEALLSANFTLDDVVCLPTGDGMCLCFIKSTDGPLTVAAHVQLSLAQQRPPRGTPKIDVRMGIHSGNVLRVTDLKGSYNLAGAAINISQRVMSFGDEGHILCTKEAYNLLKMMKDYKKAIKPIKDKYIAKHGVPLKLYNYHRREQGFGNPEDPKREDSQGRPADSAGADSSA